MSIIQGMLLDLTTQDHTLGGQYISLRDFEMQPVYDWYVENVKPDPDLYQFANFLIHHKYIYSPQIKHLEWDSITCQKRL